MLATLRRWWSDPIALLIVVACLGAFVVQSGELGSADTSHRLQTAHSFWTSEPPVFPHEYPEFGVHGRGGKLYDWYGIGQPLLLLPADIVATGIERLPLFKNYQDDPSVRSIVVSYIINMLINALIAWICFRFLQLLNFSPIQSIAGALALLFCTTHLHYTQNMMENNYIQLLTLVGFTYQYEWLRTGRRKPLLIGCLALGLDLLTRLTTGLDLIAVEMFLLLILLFEHASWKEIWQRTLARSKVAVPIYALFFLGDRLYQFYRFGSFFNTYVSVVAREYHQLDPNLPAAWPWATPFHTGFLGPLITPEKSIFLFDPLLILTMILVIKLRNNLPAAIKAYILATLALLLAYISFYARYFEWSGNFAWGDRYVSTTVELAAFISLPMLLRYRPQVGPFLWRLGLPLVTVSFVIQVASLAFWLPLEIYQMETMGHPTFVIALRFKNIAAFALGKMDAWGLTNHSMTEDPWDYVHITCWNFLPFLLRRVGTTGTAAVDFISAIWWMSVTGFLVYFGRILVLVRRISRMPAS